MMKKLLFILIFMPLCSCSNHLNLHEYKKTNLFYITQNNDEEYVYMDMRQKNNFQCNEVDKKIIIKFDYDNNQISLDDEEKLLSFIDKLNDKNTIEIYGYSDNINSENYNKELALSRAEAVKKLLVHILILHWI